MIAGRSALEREANKFLQHAERSIDIGEDPLQLSLSEYIQAGWPVLEPATELVWSWHNEAIAEHLEAISAGQIQKLIINIPPGMMKSLEVAVFWPTWEWTRRPYKRFLTASHAQSLATRDALKSRRLIQSEWYQRHWGHRFRLTGDQNQKTRYENDLTGYRVATYVDGGTGERGDYRILDDPHNARQVHSETQREGAITWLKETWASRINDPKTSAEVVIMQRLHERDASGYLLEEIGGYAHLMLPMRFEENRRCVTSLGFMDPRTKEGELLCPARYDEAAVREKEKELASYGTAGQLQQDPKPRKGGLFEADWFKIVDEAPVGGFRVRGWDLAGTEEGENPNAAWTVGVRMQWQAGVFYVEDVIRFRGSPRTVETRIMETAESDGEDVVIDFPQDPGQAGKAQAQYLAGLLVGYKVQYSTESGEKEERAKGFSAQAEADRVRLVRGPWNGAFKEEHGLFPNGRFKDQVDAGSRAFHRLVRMIRTKGRSAAAGPRTIPNPRLTRP